MPDWAATISIVLIIFLFFLWRRDVASHRKDKLSTGRLLREAESKLNEFEARMGQLVLSSDVTGDLLLISGQDLCVQYANLAAQKAFGEFNKNSSLIAYTGNLELENLVNEAVELEPQESIERVIRIAEQPHRARVMVTKEGIGIALTNIAELQRLGRARQDMITNLSHELRTPLTSLRLLADTLRGPAGKDPGIVGDLVEKIVVEVDQLHQMSEELLDLSAIESGKQVMRLVPISLKDLVDGPVDRLNDQAVRRDVCIEVNVDSDVQVLADREQASRAILNVLHNAIKYSPENAKVCLSSEVISDQYRIVLSIIDSGPGIPPGELERVFERFYRTNLAWGTPGTGLGLAIARHILQAHGGRIWAENRSLPEHGAIFHLAFPAP